MDAGTRVPVPGPKHCWLAAVPRGVVLHGKNAEMFGGGGVKMSWFEENRCLKATPKLGCSFAKTKRVAAKHEIARGPTPSLAVSLRPPSIPEAHSPLLPNPSWIFRPKTPKGWEWFRESQREAHSEASQKNRFLQWPE